MIAKIMVLNLQEELKVFDSAIENRTKKDDLNSPIISSAIKITLLLDVLFDSEEFKKLKSLGLI